MHVCTCGYMHVYMYVNVTCNVCMVTLILKRRNFDWRELSEGSVCMYACMHVWVYACICVCGM
jgi:hypothetical protein